MASVTIKTVLEGYIQIPTSGNLKTVADLKEAITKAKGYPASLQHLYQNGVEIKNQTELNPAWFKQAFVLLMAINRQTRQYKTQREIDMDQVSALTQSEINRQASVTGGTVSDQLSQIMEEFTSTHPINPPRPTTTAPPTTTVNRSTQPPRTTPTTPTATTQPPRTTTQAPPSNVPPPTIESLPLDESLISVMLEMGIARHRAKKALLLNRLDPEAAVEWIFNNIDNPGVLDSELTWDQVHQLAQIFQQFQNNMTDE